MIDSFVKNERTGSYSRRQHLFFKYTFYVLIDLTVLNLFNEFWDYVSIEFFSISLLTALLLQVLLQVELLKVLVQVVTGAICGQIRPAYARPAVS